MELKQFAKAIAWIRENIDPEINIQKIDILCKVAMKEGLGQQDLIQMTGLQSGSISRHLMKLGRYYDKRTKSEKGLGLVIQTPDPLNRRYVNVFLSDKGKETMRVLKEVLHA